MLVARLPCHRRVADLVVNLDVLQVALFVLDEDGDGKITAIEFLKWWKSTDYSLIEAYI